MRFAKTGHQNQFFPEEFYSKTTKNKREVETECIVYTGEMFSFVLKKTVTTSS